MNHEVLLHGYLDFQLLWIFLIPIHSMSAVITIQLNIVSELTIICVITLKLSREKIK